MLIITLRSETDFCPLFKILLCSLTKDNLKCILKFQRNYLKEISSQFTYFFLEMSQIITTDF